MDFICNDLLLPQKAGQPQAKDRRTNPDPKGQPKQQEGRANPHPEKGQPLSQPVPKRGEDQPRPEGPTLTPKGHPLSSFFLHQLLYKNMDFVIIYYHRKLANHKPKTDGPTSTRWDNPNSKREGPTQQVGPTPPQEVEGPRKNPKRNGQPQPKRPTPTGKANTCLPFFLHPRKIVIV